jgi:hypothetical protein
MEGQIRFNIGKMSLLKRIGIPIAVITKYFQL